MRNQFTALLFVFLTILSCKNEEKLDLDSRVEKALDRASGQYQYLMEVLPEGQYPKTYNSEKGTLETSNSGWWCSGFYPGTLLYLNELKPNPALKAEADRILKDLKREQFNTTTHDLGFMMYCSYGNANRLEPKKEYEAILMNSAKSLSTRYNDTVQAIRSWNSAPWNKAGKDDLVVIIDNMMNLELLFWATKHSGDSTFYDIAVKHANTTMEHHFRDDFSSYHEVIYDEKTGNVKAQITNQGADDESAWARGQVWGLYGYTVMYRETKDQKYLDHAIGIADFILNHPNLPEDKIPYWDFNAPNIPDTYRDSSAGAIIASCLFELQGYVNAQKREKYLGVAKEIITELSSDDYLAEAGSHGGFIIEHGLGNMPNGTEIDVPLTYGDYYFIEALQRYKNL